MIMTERQKTNRENKASGLPDDLYLIRKPQGWTSFDVVKKMRGLLAVRKAGHAGTLDPLATGLLIVGTGKGTRELGRIADLEKEYQVTMRLGARTASLDADTPVIEHVPVPALTQEQLETVLRGFVGEQRQIPPMYSAVKVKGRRLHTLARRGETVERGPRIVSIRTIRVVRFAIPDITLNVVCSKGTYIRSLVDDVGRALGTAAYVTELERVRIGDFLLENALSLDELGTRGRS